MVVRCPFCVDSEHFLKMTGHANGVYACAKCGHIEIPEREQFQCVCNHCTAMDAFNSDRERAWLASA